MTASDQTVCRTYKYKNEVHGWQEFTISLGLIETQDGLNCYPIIVIDGELEKVTRLWSADELDALEAALQHIRLVIYRLHVYNVGSVMLDGRLSDPTL
ncbi:MAG: hypothetical protein ABL949_05455 [Fimbriimonadaceae bacterium]